MNTVRRTLALFFSTFFVVGWTFAQEYKSVSSGDQHTCAVQATGSVLCWGAGANGRLGVGGTQNVRVPTQITGLPTAAQAVAAGGSHTCAVLVNREVWCWGANGHGQLGVGNFDDSSVPVRVLNITTAISITAGAIHTCAVLSDGAVRCWGAGANGRLGRGSTAGSFSPVAVSGFDTNNRAVVISAGAEHTCVITDVVTVRCWGRGSNGRLGNGDTNDRNVPTAVIGLPGAAILLAAGGAHSCATVNSSLYCWGANGAGQLGNSNPSDSSSPVLVNGLDPASAISAGEGHTCAVVTGRRVFCWGLNSDGQTGSDGSVLASTPRVLADIRAAILSGRETISAGGAHSCVVLIAGGLRCWGAGGEGQRGDGGVTSRNVPSAVSGGRLLVSQQDHVSAGFDHNCARVEGGAPNGGVVQCWGNGSGGKTGPTASTTPTDLPGLTNVSAVAAGVQHSCALLADGGVRCWGLGLNGALGNGSNTLVSPTPVVVSGIGPADPAAAVTAGGAHNCARMVSGLVRCWGLNTQGQLGNSNNNVSNTPVLVSGITAADPAVDVSAGSSHTCAALQSGIVRCWGNGANGRLGNAATGNSNVPVTVTGITAANKATRVAAGGSHSCARLNNGDVKCWGAGADGRLGDGGTSDRSTAVTVANLSGAEAVTAGERHSCANLTAGGLVFCWGDGAQGQLGHGVNAGSLAPVEVIGLFAFQVSAGGEHTCAHSTSGEVRCWGSNNVGQLGDGLNRREKAFTPELVGGCTFDIDGDGASGSLTDGLLLLRALLGFSGTAVTDQAVATTGIRRSWGEIKAHLERSCGLSGLAP